MCLSKVYLREKQKDKLLIEEASRIIVDDEVVHVDTLMGESKNLQNYSIREVNLMENYVILKGKRDEIHAPHEHSSRTEKLELGLSYLLKHNREHLKDIEKWINRAKQAGTDEVMEELVKVLELSEKINECFKTALKKLKY
ncbi:MAG: CooT family nickel-binding protein [Candidatus Omnitrophica bacterium]|nr:CooT family nickel-binding protein [Candidatus Omnitrophota bacterium]